MISLVIETSTKELGVSVLKDEATLAEYSTTAYRNHSEQLMPIIERLVEEVGLQPTDLDRIIVARGPGSYTGVRIGATVAKTLAWTLHIPLYSVSSLAAMASRLEHYHGVVVPIMDARRGTVFAGVYEVRGGKTTPVMDDGHMVFTDLLSFLKEKGEKAIFVGADVKSFLEPIQEALGERGEMVPPYLQHPRPSKYVTLIDVENPEDVHGFVPEYLRLAEAEANWMKQQEAGSK